MNDAFRDGPARLIAIDPVEQLRKALDAYRRPFHEVCAQQTALQRVLAECVTPLANAAVELRADLEAFGRLVSQLRPLE